MSRPPDFRPGSRAGMSRGESMTLVVVAVLLLAVAFPYWQHRTRSTQRSISLQNLRQWGIALNLYLVENNNVLPASGTKPNDEHAWFNTLPTYLSLKPLAGQSAESVLDIGLWTDPAAKIPSMSGPASPVTYGMNAWLHPDPAVAPYRIYDVEDPTTTFFLIASDPGRLRVLPGQMAFRHGKSNPAHPEARSHVLFCDGHVEEISPEQGNAPKASNPEANPPSRPTWIPYFQAPAPP
jgi:prepilin-type processing-associated H-X9-DG protein